MLWLLGTSGCAYVTVGNVQASPEEQQAFDAATALMTTRPAAADQAFGAFLETYPRSLLADDAAEKRAEIAFAEGRDEDGLRWLGRILSEAPRSDRAAPARLRLAQFEYARSRSASARTLLDPLDLEKLEIPDQRAALRLKVVLAQTPVERLGHLARLKEALTRELALEGADPAARRKLNDRVSVVDFEIEQGIGRAAPAELEAVLADLRDRSPAALVAMELARRAMDQGDAAGASERLSRAAELVRTEGEQAKLEALLARLGGLPPEPAFAGDLPELLDGVRADTAGARGKLGVVLPLSGDFAEFGEQSLRGLLLSAEAFGASQGPVQPAASDVRLIVRDSAGDPEQAAAAVRELAQDPEIVAVLGPVFTAESVAAAQAAEDYGIPLVSLSHRDEVPAGREQVFRTRTRPIDEVGVLVDHAFDVLGARRFAVLYPETRYGRGMRKLYWDAVRERGGKMVAAGHYAPGANDFSGPIRDMIGYRFIAASERRALAAREETVRNARNLPPEEAAAVRREAYAELGPEGQPLPPVVDFDVLFIPDSADKVSLIAPALAFHEVRGTVLLGSSDWVDPELLRVARQHVSGAIISTSFYIDSEVPVVAEFVSRFRSTFGQDPDAYAAQAYDAGNLVLASLARGDDDRSRLRQGILETDSLAGTTGILSMLPDGNARRRPFLLGVKGQRFLPLD